MPDNTSFRIFLGIALTVICVSSSSISAEESFSPYVDAQGNISFPNDFRTSMVHLGSWFVPEGGASGFHDVYTEKQSIEIFRETGKFPDGTILVKELRASDVGNYTTGEGVQFSTQTIKQWFVMVKDTEHRFPESKLWGDGWGWALFKPTDVDTNAAVDYKADCLGCHVPAKSNDWIYTEAYPILFIKE